MSDVLRISRRNSCQLFSACKQIVKVLENENHWYAVCTGSLNLSQMCMASDVLLSFGCIFKFNVDMKMNCRKRKTYRLPYAHCWRSTVSIPRFQWTSEQHSSIRIILKARERERTNWANSHCWLEDNNNNNKRRRRRRRRRKRRRKERRKEEKRKKEKKKKKNNYLGILAFIYIYIGNFNNNNHTITYVILKTWFGREFYHI